jgi:hypothetical protein
LNLETCIDELKKNGQESSPEHLKEEILKMNIFNSVFVDCTANQAVSDLYEELLNNNVSVVAANKIAASSSYENYIKLKETALRAHARIRRGGRPPRHPRHRSRGRESGSRSRRQRITEMPAAPAREHEKRETEERRNKGIRER